MCFGNSASTDRSNTLAAYGDLNKSIGSLNKTGNQLTTSGSAATGRADKYFSDILSGDPNRVAAAEAPEVNQDQKQSQQLLKTIANFGNRGGGTNQTTSNLGESRIGHTVDSASEARGKAAGGEASLGLSETSQGVGAKEGGAQAAENLAAISGRNREVSQKIHDQAINDWASLVGDVLTGKGALTALQQW